MTPITVDEIWQAIRESERSDEFNFMDDRTSIKSELARIVPPRRFQADGVIHGSSVNASLNAAFNA